MEIKDKDRNIRIKFSDFNKLYNNEPVFVDLLIEITMDIAIAKDSITIELSDFEEFVENLKKLNEKLAHTFFFQHLDEQLQIKFEPQTTGNINVTGFLKDKQYINTLFFSFEMPSTEVSNLIMEGKKIINSLDH